MTEFCPSKRQSPTISAKPLTWVLLLLLLVVSHVSAQTAPNFRLNMIMTAGIRGHMMSVQNSLSDCTTAQLSKLNCTGGVSRRAAFIRNFKLAYPNRTLTIDVGNFFFGTLFQKLDRGSVVANFFSLTGYDATGLGVADFFGGPKDLGDYLTALSTSVRVISSNLDVTAETALPPDRIQPYTVFTLADGRAVGVVGCTDDQIATVANAGARVIVNGGGNYTCNSLLARSISFMKRAYPDVNIIIAINAVSHVNMDLSLDIAQNVEGVDIVLCEFPPSDSLAPSRVVQSLFGNSVLIAAIPLISDPYAFLLGGSVLNFQVDFDVDGIIQLNTLNLNLQLLDRTQPDDPRFWTDPSIPTATPGLVNKALDQISALSKQVVGQLRVDLVGNAGSLPSNTSWLCRNTGCYIGMFVTQSLLDWCSDCEISHFNTGGLRQDLSLNTLSSPPSITRGDILNLLPFGNTLISYNIYGSDFMKAIALKSISSRGGNGFQQMSGIRIAFNPSTKGLVYMEIFDRKAQVWRPWNADSLYKVATTNFVFRGGDSFDISQYALNVNLFGPIDADNLVNSLQVYPNRTLPSVDQLDLCWATPFNVVNSWSGVPDYCTYAVSSSIANLATTCPTLNDTSFCSPGKLAYDGKYFNISSNGCSHCSGLGSCAAGGTQTCVCDGPTTDGLFAGIQMIQGVACEQIRTKKSIPTILLQAFWFSTGFVALILLVTFPYYFSIYFKNSYGILKSRVTNIVTFMLLWIGCSFGIISCALLLTPLSDTNCASLLWVLNVAFTFVMGALATRSYQVKQQQDQARAEAKSMNHRYAQLERRRILASGQSMAVGRTTSMASLDLNAFEPSRSRPGSPAVSNYRALILFSLVLSVDIILLPMQQVLSPMQLGIATAEASCTLQQKTVVQSDWTYHETCTAKNDLQWRFYTANIVAKMVITLWALGMTNEFQAISQGQALSLHGPHHAEMDWLRSSVFQMLGICVLLLLLILSDSEMQVVIGGSVSGILALILLLIGGLISDLRKQQVEIRQRKEMVLMKEKSGAQQKEATAKASNNNNGSADGHQSSESDPSSNSNAKDVNGIESSTPSIAPAANSMSSEPEFHPSFAFGPFFVLHGSRARLARGIFRAYSILFNYYRLVACFYILYQLSVNVQQATLSQAELDQSASLTILDFSHSTSGICSAVSSSFDLLSQPICTQATVCPSRLFLAKTYTSDNANTIVHTCSAHTALNLSYVFILFYLVYEAARHAWILLPSIAFIMHEQENQSQLAVRESKKPSPPVPVSSPKSLEDQVSPPPLTVAVPHPRAPHSSARLFDPASPSATSPPLSPTKSFRIMFHPTQRQVVSVHPSSPRHQVQEIPLQQQSSGQESDHFVASSHDVKINLDTPVSSSGPAVPPMRYDGEHQHHHVVDATLASSGVLADDEQEEDAQAVLTQARAEHLSRFYRSVFAIPLYLYRPVLLVSTPPEELAAQIASSRHTSSWIILAPYLLIEIPFVLTSICLALAFQKVDYQIVFAFLSALKLALEVTACWSLRLRRDLKQLHNGTIKFA